MPEVKDTAFAHVHITYDGRVFKTFRGRQARERYQNEKRILEFLEAKECDFVPRILKADDDKMLLVTTNCGKRVERLSMAKKKSLFDDLESLGVRHEDAEVRNVTYRPTDGRFCIIDFEFATLLDDPEHQTPKPWTGGEDPSGEDSRP